jgi:NAD(P)H dehydrogenase (quinone)
VSKTVTILAATGAQQTAVAARFRSAGWTVRGTSRQAASTAQGTMLAADLETGGGLETALVGTDVAVLTLPQDHRAGAMPRIASTVARTAASAGVKLLLLNTAGTIADEGEGALFDDMRAARQAIREGATPSVVLQPTVFMDNLRAPWSLPSIVNDGILAYPAPEGARISWLSHRSLADFIYSAATNPNAVGRDLRVGGPEALSGAELCVRLSERLERNIRYQRIPLDGFAAGIDQAFGAPAGQRIASLYALLDSEPDAMAVDSATADFLNLTPESVVAFAKRHAWEV